MATNKTYLEKIYWYNTYKYTSYYIKIEWRDNLKNKYNLLLKFIYTLFLGFIIITSIIAIANISRTRTPLVDIDKIPVDQRVAFLKKYGNHLERTTLSTAKEVKEDVIDYYKKILKGDLGYTKKLVRYVDSSGNHKSRYENIDPVDGIVKDGLMRSLKLLITALAIALIIGIPKGIYDSKKGKETNSTIKLFITVIGLSIPIIFLGPLLQYAAISLRSNYGIIFPTIGDSTLKHMILPTIALSLLPTMYIARITAIAMDKAYEDEYVRTAISKGNSKLRTMWVHVFRNAIVEITGSLSSVLTIIISDLALVEYLFEYKGLTYTMLRYFELGQSDVVTASALILAAIYLSFYILFQILKYVLIPRGRSSII